MSLYVVSSTVICGVSLFLLWHDSYEDGVVGRLALIVMAISNGLIAIDAGLAGREYYYLPNTLATQIGMALFLARHCYRFLKWHHGGQYEWKK